MFELTGNAQSSPTLDDLGLAAGLDQSSKHHDYLRRYEQHITQLQAPLKELWIVSGARAVASAEVFAEFLPHVAVHVISVIDGVEPTQVDAALPINASLHTALTMADMHRVSATLPRPQLIIEDGTNRQSHKRRCFKNLFLYLEHGGTYIVEDLHAAFMEKYRDDSGESVIDLVTRLVLSKSQPEEAYKGYSHDERELADAIDELSLHKKLMFVRKRGNHSVKLRDADATRVLNRRYGSTWGAVLHETPGFSFTVPKPATSNTPHIDESRFPRLIEVPALSLREYHSVTCSHGQVATLDGYVLPDTFRRPRQRRLQTRRLVDSSPEFARRSAHNLGNRRLNGRYYYLDTEYPGHFGHVMTEVVSKLEGYRIAKSIYPDLRILASAHDTTGTLPTFWTDLLRSHGVTTDDIELIAPQHTVDVEVLLSRTPQFSQPYWVDPAIVRTWALIREKIMSPVGRTADALFVSRRPAETRSCTNIDAVERLFASAGFEVAYPEEYSLPEQIRLFAHAKVIAGFGGSNMFNMMYAPPGKRFILAGTSYTAINEYYISAVNGDDMYYSFHKSKVDHPQNGWNAKAFFSNFTFDFAQADDLMDRITSVDLSNR